LKGRNAAKRERKKGQTPPAPTSEVKISPAEQKSESKPEKDNTDALKYPKIKSKPSGVEIIAHAGLVLSVVIAAIYGGQLFVMNHQLTEMAAQRRLSVRPWVGLEDSAEAIQTSALHFANNGDASIGFTLHVKNYSSVGAQNVWSSAVLLVTEDLPTIQEQTRIMCGEHVVGKRDIGFVLFPGRLRGFQNSNGFYERSKMVSHNSDGKYEAWLVGCTGYRDQFGWLYTTSFQYWLVDPETGFPLRVDPIPNSILKGKWEAWGGSIGSGTETK
jgi:hypothetical protein